MLDEEGARSAQTKLWIVAAVPDVEGAAVATMSGAIPLARTRCNASASERLRAESPASRHAG
jgi:hypothetical protein